MKRVKVRLVSSLVVVVSVAVLLATITRLAQAQAAWTVVASPGIGTLNAVASISANDVWAVGVSSTTTTLTQHWNGSVWTVVPSPTVANGKFLGVAGAATNDVWAVGFTVLGTPPLIAHWNGTAWRTVKAPRQAGVLNAVTAVSTNDVWAVGSSAPNASGVEQTLIEQWNGKKWGVVPSPNVGTQTNELLGVTAVSATDIWAVGFSEPSPAFSATLTLHWDGTSWSVVSSPSIGTLRAVAAVSTSDVWAVGDGGSSGSLIEQWNGTSWSVVANPNPSTSTNTFHGVAVVSATDIWAVGSEIDNTSGTFQTLIEQWNGTSWSVVPSPNPSASENTLDAAAADPSSGQAWAVGEFFNNTTNVRQTLTEFNS